MNKNGFQCKNCQAFGHSASNCFLQYRCVKCADSHQPGNCPRNNDRNIPLKCANCGQEHTANFSGCSKRLEFSSTGKSNTLNNINHSSAPRIFKSSFVNQGVAFSDLLKSNSKSERQNSTANSNSNQARTNTLDSINTFFNKSEDLFGIKFEVLINNVSNFLKKLNLIQDVPTQKSMYLSFLCQFLN